MSLEFPKFANRISIIIFSTLCFLGCVNPNLKGNSVTNIKLRSKNFLRLDQDQISKIKDFLKSNPNLLTKLEEQNYPSTIGLIKVEKDGKFECNIFIPKPLAYGTKWQNDKLFVYGKATAKNDRVTFFIQRNGKIEIVETTAQNAVVYAHAGNRQEEANSQEISQELWNDGNGEFEIPIDLHQIPNALLNGVKLRSTLFITINLPNGNKFDCRGKFGIINEKDKQNIGQRSNFSKIVKP